MRVRGDESYGGALFGAAALLMGLLVAVLGFAVVMMWVDARNHDKKTSSVATTTAAMPGRGAGAATMTSFAGAAPANADGLAAAHKPYPAALPAARPPLPAGRSPHRHSPPSASL